MFIIITIIITIIIIIISIISIITIIIIIIIIIIISLRSINTLKPVPDARQRCQHISAQFVNTLLVKINTRTIVQNAAFVGELKCHAQS